jgi:DNA-binding response OmpR family regulator
MSVAGKKILVVEDDLLLACDIAEELRRAPDLETAMSLAEGRHLDAAVLDVFLEGTYVWTLAAKLSARAVPFIFLTGFAGFLEVSGCLCVRTVPGQASEA